MYILEQKKSFRKDIKKLKRTFSKEDKSLLKEILKILISNKKIPQRHYNHKLSNNWKNCWDLHVKPDLVLIYQKNKDSIILVRIGSHSELFG